MRSIWYSLKVLFRVMVVRASPQVLSMSLWIKTIKCLSLAVFFGNPTNKIVSGIAYTWELLIANHLDQSLWSTNQNYWAALRSNLLHSCVACFTSRGNLHEFGAQKPISWAQPAHFDFFTINFTLWSHILSEHWWRCSEFIMLCFGSATKSHQ